MIVLFNLVIYYIENILNSNLKIILVQYQYYLFLGKNIDVIFLRYVG
jgi:hypothetical protein